MSVRPRSVRSSIDQRQRQHPVKGTRRPRIYPHQPRRDSRPQRIALALPPFIHPCSRVPSTLLLPRDSTIRHQTGGPATAGADRNRQLMPGIILSPVSSAGAIAGSGMKRAHAVEAAPAYGQPHPKKRKTQHQLHHTQPVQHIVDPISAELGDFGDCKDFFDHQLRRAIAIQCRGMGFDSAQQDALEEFRGLVDAYMTRLLAQVRKSMASSRRTEMIPHDWIYALNTAGLRASSVLDHHLDTGELPPTLLQPPFDPPASPEAQPPDTESLLGSTLSGKADKETRAYIPKHLPAFPSKHTYKATPVFTERENDPRKIREKATEEGISAEQSLRKLMAAQKAGIQKRNVGKRKRSKRMKESDSLWEEAMANLLAEEEARDKEDQQRRNQIAEDDGGWDAPLEPPIRQSTVDRNVNLEEGLHVNYEQKFWRKSARGG